MQIYQTPVIKAITVCKDISFRLRRHVSWSDLCQVFSVIDVTKVWESTSWFLQRSALDIGTVKRSLEDLLSHSFPPDPAPTTQGPRRTQMCSPDVRRWSLPGGVKQILKTNGSAVYKYLKSGGEGSLSWVYIMGFNSRLIYNDLWGWTWRSCWAELSFMCCLDRVVHSSIFEVSFVF